MSSDSKTHSLSHLLPPTYKAQITSWLEEDCPSFDYGGYVVGEREGEARLLGKSPGIVAGVPFFEEVFRQLGCRYVSSPPHCTFAFDFWSLHLSVSGDSLVKRGKEGKTWRESSGG